MLIPVKEREVPLGTSNAGQTMVMYSVPRHCTEKKKGIYLKTDDYRFMLTFIIMASGLQADLVVFKAKRNCYTFDE